MIRITTFLWVVLLVIAGGTVMHVSYQVRRVQQHVAELSRATHQEQDAIRILNAEWDTLNDPHRIDDLSKRYLTLQPTPIQRVVALESVPLKLSEEQLLRLNASGPRAAGAKKADPTIRPPMPSASSPTIVAASPRMTPLPLTSAAAHVNTARPGAPIAVAPGSAMPRAAVPRAPVDEVGLILARMERHE